MEIREGVVYSCKDEQRVKNLNDNLKFPLYMFPAAGYSVYWRGRAGLDGLGDVITETQ